MLRVRDEELSRSGSRGRGPPRREVGQQTEEEDDDEEEGFSESELELYEQYKAAGYRDLVGVLQILARQPKRLRLITSSCCRCGTARKRRLSLTL